MKNKGEKVSPKVLLEKYLARGVKLRASDEGMLVGKVGLLEYETFNAEA